MASPCILEGWSNINDGVLEPSEAELDAFSKKTVSLNQAKRHLVRFQWRQCRWTKQSLTWRFYREDSVLEPSKAPPNAFPKKTVYFNQAKQDWTPFQRKWCPWTKRSSTWRVFNEESVLEPREASFDAFTEKTVSVNQAKRHLMRRAFFFQSYPFRIGKDPACWFPAI